MGSGVWVWFGFCFFFFPLVCFLLQNTISKLGSIKSAASADAVKDVLFRARAATVPEPCRIGLLPQPPKKSPAGFREQVSAGPPRGLLGTSEADEHFLGREDGSASLKDGEGKLERANFLASSRRWLQHFSVTPNCCPLSDQNRATMPSSPSAEPPPLACPPSVLSARGAPCCR